jgi:hypothetical protein
MNFELGSRTTHTATKLVTRLKHYIGKLVVPTNQCRLIFINELPE